MKINKNIPDSRDEGEEEGGEGKSTGVSFHYTDILSSPYDKPLPPEEVNRLLMVHSDLHKGIVNKQKQTRRAREALKQGRIQQQRGVGNYHGAGRSANISPYKPHPMAIKFSGVDPKVSLFPNESENVANEEMKNELQNRLDKKLQLQHAPSFNPKPRPY